MDNSRQSFSQENFQAMDKFVEPPKPRTRQILKQYPRGRGKNGRIHQEPRRQQTKRCYRQMPQGVAIEVPIRDLEPLRTLNAFRRDLGLGPSRNLISSAIYNYDPTMIAELYEKTMTGGSSSFPQFCLSAQHQTHIGSLDFLGAPIDSSTGGYHTSNSSLSYQHYSSDKSSSETRPSTSQQSGDRDSINICRGSETSADKRRSSHGGAQRSPER
ncbi:hypothetical protein F4782DRAFT_507377 [Xylaria castorea]|nr:hypothetical protein F4782DRAFT_507377 [Xylaria castorea]